MNANIEACLERADELTAELEAEYISCLAAKEVSARAKQLTHEVAERLRSALDRMARVYWDQKIRPSLPDEEHEKAVVYFPIVNNDHALDSTLGRWRWKSVQADHASLHGYLRATQPYVDQNAVWLRILSEVATEGKHVDLIPQTKTVQRHTVIKSGLGMVLFGPGVKFGNGVSIMGAPVDPKTQRIVPTPGVKEEITDWVSFQISGYGVEALDFLKSATQNTRKLVQEFWTTFSLS